MNKTFFITGIDTNCGKTYVTGQIAKYLLEQGKKVITQKLIQTGCSDIAEDIEEHRRIMGIDLLPEDLDKTTCSQVLSYPCSPHLAAQIDETEIDLTQISTNTEKLKKTHEIVLIEGAGGLHVPIKKGYHILHYIKEHNFRVILVSSSKLGSINHTLLSIDACKQNNIEIAALVYNQFPEDDELIAEDSAKIIEEYYKSAYAEGCFVIGNGISSISELF